MTASFRTHIIGNAYRRLLKPVLFRVDPEIIHDRFTALGEFLGASAVTRAITRLAFSYRHPMLRTTVEGITFPNPIGLAAGFDKNARLLDVLPAVGFGFTEIGSITGRPCAGNSKPRLWRLPQSKALVVYYGLMNDGADIISERLRGVPCRFPVGISAAKTNDQRTADPEIAIADYCHVVERFRGIGDYLTVNISCPNAFGGEPFTDPALLDRLLTSVDRCADKPVFVKLAADLTPHQLDAILDVATRHAVAGFVCSNLTKDRSRLDITGALPSMKGGISGKAVQYLSDEQIRHVYRRTGGKYSIIGVGGIFTAEDAYRKIRAGASLVQLITGMIYEGPQLIGDLNRGLVRLLERDGFASVADAVGVDNRS